VAAAARGLADLGSADEAVTVFRLIAADSNAQASDRAAAAWGLRAFGSTAEAVAILISIAESRDLDLLVREDAVQSLGLIAGPTYSDKTALNQKVRKGLGACIHPIDKMLSMRLLRQR